MSWDAQQVLSRLRQVVGSGEDFIALHEPCFAGNEWDYVKECLDTGWVSSVGKFVDRFEADLAKACGVDYAVAVVNGTAALHLALIVAGVKPGDEVLIPTLTFVATANAVAHASAIPHLVDSSAETLGMDPVKLAAYLAEIAVVEGDICRNKKTGRRIAALVPMHTFGHPVDLDPLTELAAAYKIPMVEDATEGLGSLYKGRPTGSFGLLSALSFNGNKIATTGGGGAILTNDPAVAKRAKYLSTTAKDPHRWEFSHQEIGYNYRLPNINAALGCAQLEQLEGFVASKRRLAAHYADAFDGLPGMRFFKEPEFAQSNYWLNCVILDEDQVGRRDEFLALTNDAGLMTRPTWKLMHHLPMYADVPRMDLAVAENLERRIINIPSSAKLGKLNAI